jgi:hypothetical protein
MLLWDQTDFIWALEVNPVSDEYGNYHFTVEKHELRLQLTITELTHDISFFLYKIDLPDPIFSMRMYNCPRALLVPDENGDYLEFASANVYSDQYEKDWNVPIGVRLRAKPQIRITLY